jgi:hypothetical protein
MKGIGRRREAYKFGRRIDKGDCIVVDVLRLTSNLCCNMVLKLVKSQALETTKLLVEHNLPQA